MTQASLAAQKIRLNAVDILQSTVDPSAGAGVAAQIGSLYVRSGTAQLWTKTDAGDTQWQQWVQSFDWYSVKDYHAVGNGVTDDTAAIQAAIDACAAAGGGVVFFPYGTYVASAITLTGQDNVQLMGSGPSSIIKWVLNAGGAAASLLTISAGCDHTRVSMLKFDGSGLTNPAAGRTNHLVSIVGAGGGVTETQFFNCIFTGMVAGSGDGVHFVGTAGNLVSRLWVSDSVFDGCSHFSVGGEQGWEYLWINGCYMANCETEIALVATAALTAHGVQIYGNELLHSGAVRHALRIEGSAAAIMTKAVVSENVIDSGMTTLTNIQYVVWNGNVQTSGAYASADPVLRVFGDVEDCVISACFMDRAPGASVGPVLTVEKATSSPIRFRIGNNILSNETVAGGFIKLVDVTDFSVGSNLCRSSDAGASTMYGIDVQAVTVALANALIGPGNHLTAAAGSMAGGVHLLANGANITAVSVVGNQGSSCDYGLVGEVGGGGGTFGANLPFYAGNNFDSAVGDWNAVGVTLVPRIGFNAASVGANLFTGDGSPAGAVSANIGSMYLRRDGGANSAVYFKETGSGNGGWVALAADPIVFGTGDTTTAATAVFMAPGFIQTATATELQAPMTRAGTLRNLRLQVATAGTDNQTVAVTVRKNGADTTLTCSIANNASGGASDTTHTVAVVAGDLVSESIVKGGVVTAGQQFMVAAMELA